MYKYLFIYWELFIKKLIIFMKIKSKTLKKLRKFYKNIQNFKNYVLIKNVNFPVYWSYIKQGLNHTTDSKHVFLNWKCDRNIIKEWSGVA